MTSPPADHRAAAPSGASPSLPDRTSTSVADGAATDSGTHQGATGRSAGDDRDERASGAATATPARDAPARRATPHHTAHLRATRFEIGLAIAIVAFGVLAFFAHRTPYFAFDLPIERAIQSLDVPWLVAPLEAVSWVGFPPQVAIITGLLVVGLFMLGARRGAVMLLVAGVGGAALWFSLAPLIGRPRPDPSLVRVVGGAIHSSSFPSGHVLNVTVIFGFLVFLAYTRLRHDWLRVIAIVVFALPVVTVGIARIYDGYHWPSDVLGGYLVGGIWLAVVIALYRRWYHRTTREEASAS